MKIHGVSVRKHTHRFLLLGMLLASSCSPKGEGDISRGMELYRSGDAPRAVLFIEKGLIDFTLIEKYSPPYPEQAGEALISRGKNDLSLVYPVNMKIKNPGDAEVFAYNAAQKRLAISKGGRIIILDRRGRISGEVTLSASAGTRVRALAWERDSIICYAGEKLYRCTTAAGLLPDLVVNESFPPSPAGSYYSAAITATPEYILLVTGIAGQYTMSGIDPVRKTVLFRNIQLSSPELLMRDNKVFYIAGSAGQWKLVSLSMDGRNRKELGRFPSLTDIGIFREGVLYENRAGLNIFYFTEGHTRLPFHYTLRGSCGNHALIEYGNKLYVTDSDAFLNRIRRLQEEMPDLFRGKD